MRWLRDCHAHDKPVRRGKEPFWQQASTHLVKFVILLHQVLDDYVTLFQVYKHVINADKLRDRIEEGERHFRANHRRIVVDKREHLFTTALTAWSCHDDATGTRTWAEWSADLAEVLGSAWTVEHATPPHPTLGRQGRPIRSRQAVV